MSRRLSDWLYLRVAPSDRELIERAACLEGLDVRNFLSVTVIPFTLKHLDPIWTPPGDSPRT